MPDTLESANAKLSAISRELTDRREAAQAYAEATVDQARKLAAGRPTPQARLAASGIEARDGAVYGGASRIVSGFGGSVPLGEIAWGAEMCSSIYQQFGPRHSRGAWLYPAGDSDATVAQVENDWVDAILDRHL
jgi:hypothetical protein